MSAVRRVGIAALFVALLVAGWSFAARNPAPVEVDLIAYRVEDRPLWLVLAAAFGAGAMLAGLAGLYRGLRLSLVARRWRRTAGALESELHQLRNLPLAAGPEAPLRGSGGSASAVPRVPEARARSG